MTPEEFRRAGHDLIDWIADYRATLESRPVMARTAPGEVAAALPEDAARRRREPFEDDPRTTSTRSSSPASPTGSIRAFFGYFPANGSLASVLGDFLSTGLGVLGLTWQSRPALTELEEVVTDWVRQMVGLSAGVARRHPGHRVDRHARGAALRARAGHRLRAQPAAGCRRERLAARRLRLGAGPQLGRQGGAARRLRARRTCASRDRRPAYAMRPEALDRAMREDHAPRLDAVRGRRHDRHDDLAPPSIRSTRSPPSAREHGAWLHVDAAMAGSAMVLPEMPAGCGPASSAPTRSC